MNKNGSSKVPGGNKTVSLTTDFTEQGATGTSWKDSVGCRDLMVGLCDLGTGVCARVRRWFSELPRTPPPQAVGTKPETNHSFMASDPWS